MQNFDAQLNILFLVNKPLLGVLTVSGQLCYNLKLNVEKTELLIIGTPQQLDKVVITHICVVNTNIYPVPVARNLGLWFNANISMTDYISKICSSSSSSHIFIRFHCCND